MVSNPASLANEAQQRNILALVLGEGCCFGMLDRLDASRGFESAGGFATILVLLIRFELVVEFLVMNFLFDSQTQNHYMMRRSFVHSRLWGTSYYRSYCRYTQNTLERGTQRSVFEGGERLVVDHCQWSFVVRIRWESILLMVESC
jgi:hypothetical protein